MSFGCRGLFGVDIPIDTEFFQCTPIFILLFDGLDIVSSLIAIETIDCYRRRSID